MHTPIDSKAFLREKGLRATPKRLSVLEVFSKKHIPLSTDMILAALPKGSMDESTLYRMLSDFTQEGILETIDFKKGRMFYELKDEHSHHHHIVCMKCSEVEDIHACNIENIAQELTKTSKKFNGTLKHSLEFFGICKKCVTKR